MGLCQMRACDDKKIKLFDWIGVALILGIGFFLDVLFPTFDWLARIGALCVVVALFIAGSNSKTVNYEILDGFDIMVLPSINVPKEEIDAAKNANKERREAAKQVSDALFVGVPFWAH